MTVLLVLLTLIMFLAVDFYIQKRQAAKTAVQVKPRLATPTHAPTGTVFAPNHLWVRPDGDGNLVVGLSQLLGTVVGSLDEIILPELHARVTCESDVVALRSGLRQLRLNVPLGGRVVAVNAKAQTHPGTATRDPYGDGWLLKMHPNAPLKSDQTLMRGEQAGAWLNSQLDLMKDFFRSLFPAQRYATALDGGPLREGLLQQFDDGVWNEFQKRFVTVGPVVRSQNPSLVG